ncbi:hypothetical protein HPP92_009849 [Vanilla planifolia]|uniref:Uncharacterized protein n=1 Tax=Vanilla planifolia TaxID=51239 RepID=A0A835V6Q1_VANPL|nr:hypothetical protein HPP92_009849 [Vanilla planifolia]
MAVLLAHEIVEDNDRGQQPPINIKLIENSCVGEDYRWPQNAICAAHLKTFNKIFDEINRYSILDPKCSDEPPILKEITVSGRSLEENPAEFLNSASEPQISCITGDLLATYWGNHPLVLEALHVKKSNGARGTLVVKLQGWSHVAQVQSQLNASLCLRSGFLTGVFDVVESKRQIRGN